MELINYFDRTLRGVSGVYRIRNLSNNHCYIGSSNNLYNRYIQHKQALVEGTHHSIYLQRAYNKYGSTQFIMEVLLLCKQEYLLYYEQLLILELHPIYNMNKIASSNRGYRWSKASREKARVAQLGNKNALGHRLSDESRRKISNSRKGKYKGLDNWIFGKSHSEETKRRLSMAHLGKKHSEEHKSNIAKAHYKPIIANGVLYKSLKEASEKLNINKTTLSRWCKDERKLNYAFM